MNIDDDGIITFTVQPHGCPACGHEHGGHDVGYICVGCPCPETPGRQELAPDGCLATDHARGQHTPDRPGSEAGCDGDHPRPPCASRTCWHKTPLRSAHAQAKISEAQELGCEDDEIVRADLHELARGECHCSGFRCSKHLAQDELRKHRPKVVVLCGSMRFYADMRQAMLDEGLAGNIVLAPAGFGTSDAHPTMAQATPAQKEALDELHKKKIDLADEVLVLNVDGYIGKSTAGEIEYAEMCGKPIRWLVAP